MTIEFLNEINAMILLPDKPLVGDYIATDWDEQHPSDWKDQNISWYCAQVIEVDGDKYKMSYDDSWYTFTEFGTPKPSKLQLVNIYPAIPAI